MGAHVLPYRQEMQGPAKDCTRLCARIEYCLLSHHNSLLKGQYWILSCHRYPDTMGYRSLLIDTLNVRKEILSKPRFSSLLFGWLIIIEHLTSLTHPYKSFASYMMHTNVL